MASGLPLRIYEIADFAFDREPADLLLREDGLAVQGHFENASGAADQFGLHSVLTHDFSGRTGRHGEVVSLRAVGDDEFHGLKLSPSCRDLKHPRSSRVLRPVAGLGVPRRESGPLLDAATRIHQTPPTLRV